MNLSIRTRLSFSFAFIFTALIILFSGVIYYLMSSNLEKELAEDSAHDIKQVLHVFSEGQDGVRIGTWETQLAEMPEESEEFSLLIQLLDEKGRVLYRTEGVKEWDWPVDEKIVQSARQMPIWSNSNIQGVSHLILTQSFVPKMNPTLHFLQVANSRADIDRIRNRLIYCINIGTPIILVLAIFIGRFFSKWALMPVERIRRRAETIKSDSLIERLVYDGPPDELSRLTDTLNGLLGRIQITMEQMKRFIADASHELRIPLTGLRGTLEVALRQDRSQEEYRQILENSYHETERLSELVWDLLSLARADAGEMKLEPVLVDIHSFLQNVHEEAGLLNADGNVQLQLGGLPEGKAVFDEAKIHQLLINLVENGIRYNKPGGSVVLSGEVNHGSLKFSVKDTGIGISPEDQLKVFDRFYRVDKARSREAGGTGLGLAIARSIAEAHKGSLELKSRLGQGSEFILTIPLKFLP